jgi:hypothetical protein
MWCPITAPVTPPTVAPMIAPRAVLPATLPTTAPAAAPPAAPITAPFCDLFHVLQPTKKMTIIKKPASKFFLMFILIINANTVSGFLFQMLLQYVWFL